MVMSFVIGRSLRESGARTALLAAGGLAAFAAYFAMYAFRKPFTAGTYDDMGMLPFGLDYKTGLLIAQVIGYALSKLIGIRVIAEFGRRGRAAAILGLIGASWFSLLLFAILPKGWGPLCLLLNGLPLGMIWGLVFSYVEGRRCSEMLGAMLCASFIVSSGAVKSVAIWLMQQGISEHWMPVAAGALFAPILLLSLWYLERLPPPDAGDEAERTARVPMRRGERAAFLREHGLTMAVLVAGYVLLTALRDLRDNFAVEIWTAMGLGDVASIFSQSELPVAVIALVGLGMLMLVRNNIYALLAMHGVIIFGAMLLGVSTLAFQSGLLGPLPWMILSGAGLYLGYTPFNAMLFDRMIAALGRAGNAGFLIYIADSSGYLGSIALLFYRSFAVPDIDWLPFFIACAYATAVSVGVLTLLSALQFVGMGRQKGSAVHA
ncbi:hypothetical protein SAMN02927924_04119 [Sphingobium faniae]|nr:hypothetical protein SAMN02927924_04119 [Sphingobium faniae]